MVECGVFHGGQVGHVLGEGLVEPEVVPPAHRYEVPEPHVGKLVEHGDGAALHLGVGDLAAEDVAFEDGHGPCVFHGPGVELGDEELVVLLERVRAAELGLEELEALPGEFEDVVRVQVLHERFAGEDAQRGDLPVGGDNFAADGLVRPGDQGRDVGREARRGSEFPDGAGAAVGAGDGLDFHRGGELEMTSQCEGAVTVNVKLALRSGCSNTANIRRESGTSNCV